MLQCSRCQYDLTGLPDGACPECGQLFAAVLLRQAARAREERIDIEKLAQQVRLLVVLVVLPVVALIAGSSVRGLVVAFGVAVVVLVVGQWLVLKLSPRDRENVRWRCAVAAGLLTMFACLGGLAGSLSQTCLALAFLGLTGWKPSRLPWLAAVVCMPLVLQTLAAVQQAAARAPFGYLATDLDWHDRRALLVADLPLLVVLTLGVLAVGPVAYAVRWALEAKRDRAANRAGTSAQERLTAPGEPSPDGQPARPDGET